MAGGILGALVNIPEMVNKYISKIGKNLAKQNGVSPAEVKVMIVYNEKAEPAIAFYMNDAFVKWLTSDEIETLCSD
jgi:hypothetical protein